jgi:hypothetical protein
VYSELRQVASAYPYNGDIMLMSNKGIVITDKEKKRLESSLKIGIYKELNKKSLITERQLRILVEKENKLLQ